MRLDTARKSRYKWVNREVEVSFVTVNRNGIDDTARLIESVRENVKSVIYEIIVVDNASHKDEALHLYKKYPYIRIVRRLVNTGLAGGYNTGAHVAVGKYLYFLHNDAFLADDHVGRLKRLLDSHPDADVVCPAVKGTDGIEQGVLCFDDRLWHKSPMCHRYKWQSEDVQASPSPISCLNSVAFFVRREALRDYGMLPRMYGLYYEDIDWSCTLASHGRGIYAETACTVFHRGRLHGMEPDPDKLRHLIRCCLLFTYRNVEGSERMLFFLYLLLCRLPCAWLRYRRQKRPDMARSIIEGVRAYFGMTADEKLDDVHFKFPY